MECSWINNTAKSSINPKDEYFLAVKWIRTTTKELGYWEKGMTSLPMVAYAANDDTTYKKVLKHFNLTLI